VAVAYHLTLTILMMLTALRPLTGRHTKSILLRTLTTVPCYQVDSFSNQPFAGNPAAVCLLDSTTTGEWPLTDSHLLQIAAENNLSETAFIIPQHTTSDDHSFTQESHFHLRWFTPTTEVDLCGHATLATAAVLLQKCNNTNPSLYFATKSGELVASAMPSMPTDDNQTDSAIEMELPLNPPLDLSSPAAPYLALVDAVLDSTNGTNGTVEGIVESVSYSATTKKFVVTLDATQVDRSYLESLNPSPTTLLNVNQTALGTDNVKGVIVTLQDTEENSGYDFISRYFAPWVGIEEDPVTGSAHTVLAPMWSKRFKDQTDMKARQCSPRGGDLGLRVDTAGDGKLYISGEACVVLEGTLRIE
jgi:PhzF family phenazine biosynthesis protein